MGIQMRIMTNMLTLILKSTNLRVMQYTSVTRT